MEASSEEALTCTKVELEVYLDDGTNSLSEASTMILIKFKEDIKKITRDSPNDTTTSTFEALYPKVKLKTMEEMWFG